jgi:hypothetical protein
MLLLLLLLLFVGSFETSNIKTQKFSSIANFSKTKKLGDLFLAI